METDVELDVPSLAGLIEEQGCLQLPRFDYEFAWELGCRLRQRARSDGLPVAIEIRHGTDVVFSALAAGATIDNFDWVRRKCAVAHRFQRSSLYVRLEAEEKGYDFNARFRLPTEDFVASGGGFPLILEGGTYIGSVGVSGLSDVEDHRLITSCLTALLGRQPTLST
jgi:uncharacterized protein (UPF0303 family)